jgi:flagellar hook-basal body complex protein FliE
MNIDAIEFIPPGLGIEQVSAGAMQKPEGDFMPWIKNEISQTNEMIINSGIELRKLATGETSNLHHVMMALDKANTSFQLVLQVRNKVLDGYQEIMRMQV